MTDPRRAPALERIMRRVQINPKTSCWEWTGPIRKDGYTQVSVGGKYQLAHRIAYEAIRGPIPPALVIDHLCRNRRCVNPDHMEPVEFAENIRRGKSMEATRAYYDRLWEARTHCPNGHVLAQAGLLIRQSGGYTTRQCKACRKEEKRRAYERVMQDPERRDRLRAKQRFYTAAYKARLKGIA